VRVRVHVRVRVRLRILATLHPCVIPQARPQTCSVMVGI